jgi:hypothetical protein
VAAAVGAVGREGGVAAVGGGSGIYRDAAPVAYNRAPPAPSSVIPLILLLLLIAVPPVALTRL